LYGEYIIISRGGQGGVTAARILASAAGHEGLYAQAMAEFGAERRGAIVRSYLRVSDKPIRRYSMIRKPTGVVIFSEKVLDLLDTSQFIPEDSVVILNTQRFTKHVKAKAAYIIDATSIALKHNLILAGWPVVNTAMAAAMAKVYSISSLESLKKALEEYFHGDLLIRNKAAVEDSWNSVKSVIEVKPYA